MRSIDTVFYAICILLLINCRKKIELDYNDEAPKLVINSQFKSGDNFYIEVSNSIGSNGNNSDIHAIENATVKLFDKNNNFIENVQLSRSPFPEILSHYYSNIKCVAGNGYKIEVSAPGYETTYAESYAPFPTEILNLTKSTQHLSDGKTQRIATIQFQDRGNEQNYYEFHLEEGIYNKVYDASTGKTDTIFESSSTLKLTPSSIDVVGSRIDSKYIFFKDNSYNGDLHSISFAYTPDSTYAVPNNKVFKIRGVLLTMSKDIFNFYTSLNLYNQEKDNPFTLPVPIYSNIENGIGVFGGSTFRFKSFYTTTQ